MYISFETTILKMYNATKSDKIKFVMHQTYRSIIVSSIIT